MADPQPENPVQAVAARLASSGSALSSLPHSSLLVLAAAGKLAKAALGRVLVQPGKMPEAVFIVLEGRVRLLGIGSSPAHPELIQTLHKGGIAGIASLAAGCPIEAATVAEDCVLLVIPAPEFQRLAASDAPIGALQAGTVFPVELFHLLSLDFSRHALDATRAAELARTTAPAALISNSAEPRSEDGTVWWIAEGALRGRRWTTEDGAVRRIGLPVALLEEGGISAAVEKPGSPEPEPLPSAETLLDPLKDFPSITTANGPSEEVVACFEMLARLFARKFPKEAVRRVLSNELKKDKTPTLHICGAMASIAGFTAQLVKMPPSNLDRVETPALIYTKDGICVLYQNGARGIVLGDPRSGLHRLSIEEFLAGLPQQVEVLLLRPLPETTKSKFGFRWFLPAIKKHKKFLIEVFIASFFIQLLGLANPLLTQVIIDKVLVQNSLSTLNVLGVLFVLIAIATVALTAARTYLFVDTTNRIDLALGSRIMDHLYKLTLGYFQRRPVGEVSSRLRELENIREFLTGTALTVGLDAIFSLIYIGIMLFYDIKLTFVALVVVPLMAGITILAAPVLQRQIRRRAEKGAESQAHLIETITGVQTLKAGNIEQPSRWEWQKRYAGYVSAGFHAIITSTAVNSSTTLLSRLGDLAVLWYGATLVIKGELTLGQLIAFRIISGYVTTPLMRLAQSWQNFQEVALSIERLGDVIDSPAEQSPEKTSSIPMPALKGKVEFDSITFTYVRGQQPQLRNVSFQIPAGSFVGVVGKSGSGKSTVLKLLPRLYEPDSGRILVDDYEIAKVELYSLRRQIGTVLQDSLLFNTSVFENIAVGNPDASPDEVMRAARAAVAHDFIMGLPQGYNTPVGEQGRALSGGQRQRIAIARTVLQSPSLLILDEATSALDFPAEHQVCANLKKEFTGKTVFFVTHRVRAVSTADVILVFDRGILIEQGRHDELMALKGHYHALQMSATSAE